MNLVDVVLLPPGFNFDTLSDESSNFYTESLGRTDSLPRYVTTIVLLLLAL